MRRSRVRSGAGKRALLWPVIITAAVTLVATLLVQNFATGEKQIKRAVKHEFAVESPQFQRAMATLLGPPLVEGNKVETLLNGNAIFPAMLGAIRSATKTITFETYIYWSGEIGRRFAEALSERSRAGVKVHVIVDWLGSQKMDEESLKTMRDSGVEIEKYHPVRWYTLDKLNNRTHRKVLVVDGRIGFTGGVGIADKWDGNAQDADHWRDMPTMFHCKVLVVDRRWTSVGSTNFDERSFRLNDEANLSVYDEGLAREQTAVFEEDLKRSRPVTLEQWLARPWTEKLKERAASLLNAQL